MVDWRRLSRKLGIVLKLRDPPNLPPYGWSYFDHLVAVYVTLNVANPSADLVIRKSRERPDDLNWGDIFLLENLVFTLQPPEVLERTAWILRERLREISCPNLYDKYIASKFPTETDTPVKQLLFKADLTRLLDLLHWYYSLIPIRERIRKSLTINCILMVLTYTVLLGVTMIWCRHHDASYLAMLAFVVYGGIIGGFVSSQRRMQNIPTDGDPLLSVFGLDNAGYYLWLSPLLGAVFAVVLTLMFVGGVLEGAAFPAFHSVGAKGQPLSFFEFAWHTLPVSSEDYGKLFVWAFLAGFAERLVPDSLDRLGGKLQQPKQSTAGPLPPPPPPPPPPGGSQGTATGGAQLRFSLHGTAATDDSAEQVDPDPVPPEKPAAAKLTDKTLENVMHTGELPVQADSTQSNTDPDPKD